MLNAQLCAATFGVPIVWERNEDNQARHDCDHYLTRRDGLLDAVDLQSACPQLRRKRLFESSATNSAGLHLQAAILQRRLVRPARGVLTFCGPLNRPLFHHALMNPTLSSSEAAVLKRRLRGGLLRAYGHTFGELFEFTPVVKALADPLIAGGGGPLIGIHVRHLPAHRLSWSTLHKTVVAAAVKSARARASSSDGHCRIAIASETDVSIAQLTSAVAGRCQVVTVPRRLEDKRTGFEGSRQRRDHGDFVGLTFMAELYMLSQCEVVFGIGGSSSGELVAALALQHGGHEAFLCHVDATCSNVTASASLPERDRSTRDPVGGCDCSWTSHTRCDSKRNDHTRCWQNCCRPPIDREVSSVAL